MPAKIIVAVEDLFFLAKIQEVARQQGILTEAVRASDLPSKAEQAGAFAVILDLNDRSGASVEAIRSLKVNPKTSRATILGFASHVQAELIGQAKRAGCDQVLARSRFSQQLPELLAMLAKDAEARSVESPS